MWNILIVLVILIILWTFNPLSRVNLKSPASLDNKTKNEVNQVVNEVTQQVNYARQIQEEGNRK